MYIAMNWIVVWGIALSSFFLYFDGQIVPKIRKEVINFKGSAYRLIHRETVNGANGFQNISEKKKLNISIIATKTSAKVSGTLIKNANLNDYNNTLIDYFNFGGIRCQTCVGTTFDWTGFKPDVDGCYTRKNEKYGIAMPTKKAKDCPRCDEAIERLATIFRMDILLCWLLGLNYGAVTIVSCLYFSRA